MLTPPSSPSLSFSFDDEIASPDSYVGSSVVLRAPFDLVAPNSPNAPRDDDRNDKKYYSGELLQQRGRAQQFDEVQRDSPAARLEQPMRDHSSSVVQNACLWRPKGDCTAVVRDPTAKHHSSSARCPLIINASIV